MLYSESTAESASSNPKTNDAVSKNKGGGPTYTAPPAKGTTPTAAAQEKSSGSNLQFSTSSISEYLIDLLPGWHVEDLLDSSSPSPSAGCKSGDNDLVLPFWDADLHSSSGFPTENMGFWVPRVQVHQTQNQSFQSSLDNNNSNNNSNNLAFGIANGCKDQLKEFSTNSIKSTRKRSEDNSFAVPQITPPSAAVSKRSRNFW